MILRDYSAKLLISALLFGTISVCQSQSNYWRPTNGPTGGTIHALVVSPTGAICAATAFGGIYRSTDNGDHWVQTNLTNDLVWDISVNAKGLLAAVALPAIYESTDDGVSWSEISTNNTGSSVVAVNDSGHIFVSQVGAPSFTYGISRSTNNGASWTDFFFAAQPIQSLLFNSAGTLFAGSFGLYRSIDNGDHWTETALDTVFVSSIAANSGDTLFAGSNQSGIFRSTNSGGTWTETDTSLAKRVVVNLVTNPKGYVFAATLGGGVFRSTNQGGNWTHVSVGIPDSNVYALSASQDGHIFAGLSTGFGVFRSTDDATNWDAVIDGLKNTYIYSLAAGSSGYLFAGTDGGVFRTTDTGNSWQRVDSGFTSTIIQSLLVGQSGTLFAGTHQGGIYRSADFGTHWSQADTGLPGLTTVYALSSDHQGDLFAGVEIFSGGGVYRSTDNGDHWIVVRDGQAYNSLVVTAADNVFAGAADIIRSTNIGADWSQVYACLSPCPLVVSLTTDSAGDIFAGILGQGVIRSTDNGDYWEKKNTGLYDIYVSSLATNRLGQIFAATESYPSTVFFSSDKAENWSQIGGGLTGSQILSLAIDSSGFIYAGTLGNGVFRSVESTTSVRELDPELPSEFGLSQNYPNPFNPSTDIRFQIRENSTVTLRILDVLGQEITSLVERKMTPGNYTARWDATNSPTGVYFYQLKTEKFTRVKKMLLMR